jgi:hypothetical protein
LVAGSGMRSGLWVVSVLSWVLSPGDDRVMQEIYEEGV